ncbi:hypothetical protein RMATCC62417_14248 [Rhizopus microsporus]|nr:hypothetical protein RMATCC62417_14248 [Rhizopus microsporus]
MSLTEAVISIAVSQVVNREAGLLNTQPKKISTAPDTSDLSLSDDATDTTPTDHGQDILVSTADTILDDMRNVIPLQPWMHRGTNVAERFTSFKQALVRVTASKLLYIEPSVHKLLVLSNILLLCTNQRSPRFMSVFTEDLLDNLNKDLKADISDDAYMKLAPIIGNVNSKQLTKNDAEIELLILDASLAARRHKKQANN